MGVNVLLFLNSIWLRSTRAAPMHSFDELKDHTWSRGNPYLSRRYHFEVRILVLFLFTSHFKGSKLFIYLSVSLKFNDGINKYLSYYIFIKKRGKY